MKPATLAEIKRELAELSEKELVEVCLRMAKYKVDNKELLNYILFESIDEENFKQEIKNEIELAFDGLISYRIYQFRKGVRKILAMVNKYAKYSGLKPTKVELLIHFCKCLRNKLPNFEQFQSIDNIYKRQVINIEKNLAKLNEDLQFDYQADLEDIRGKAKYFPDSSN